MSGTNTPPPASPAPQTSPRQPPATPLPPPPIQPPAPPTPPPAAPSAAAAPPLGGEPLWAKPSVSIYALSIFVVAFVVAYMSKDATSLSMMMGASIAMAQQVVNYWMGSSSGSARKTDQLAAIAPASTNQP